MRLVLEIMSGPKAGQKIIAQAGESVSIGRTKNADVELQDIFMSGQHFAIECVGGGCGVRDLKSRNGTKVNGEIVKIAVLSEGDKISAGQTDFMVHIEADDEAADQGSAQLVDTIPPTDKLKKLDEVPVARKESFTAAYPDPRFSVPKRSEPLPAKKTPKPLPEKKKPTVAPAMNAYEAATPEGTLMRLLQDQPEPLMALVDAARDRRVLELLHSSGEEYRLLSNQQNETISPLLVRIPRQSLLLKEMIHEGWGRGWGVYLACSVPLADLREYFRQALMVIMPDGVEMFSRFYDPRFFRRFLEGCTAAEAQKVFGPISAYFMEADKKEILLEFRKSSTGVEKKGHLLTRLD